MGVGVHPQVDVSLGHGEELCLDMGHAMARDVISKTFTLYNSSPLQVRYLVSMETLVPKKHVSKSFSECQHFSHAFSFSERVFFMPRGVQLQWAAPLYVCAKGRRGGGTGDH